MWHDWGILHSSHWGQEVTSFEVRAHWKKRSESYYCTGHQGDKFSSFGCDLFGFFTVLVWLLFVWACLLNVFAWVAVALISVSKPRHQLFANDGSSTGHLYIPICPLSVCKCLQHGRMDNVTVLILRWSKSFPNIWKLLKITWSTPI